MSRTPSPRAPLPAALAFERSLRADLHRRRWVRLHVLLIGLVMLGVLWGLSHALMLAGIDSMTLRHGTALFSAYAVYLGLLWVGRRPRTEGSVRAGLVTPCGARRARWPS